MTAPADREFAILDKGFIRDKIVLANFRNGLRSLVNPETGQLFTEDEIKRATQAKSRWYVEADAIDDLGQAEQRRAIYLSDQIRIDRASTSFLEGFHGKQWGVDKLPASGGSGGASQLAVPGTVIIGSTTIGDPAAYRARDPAGKLYQVFTTVVTPAAVVPQTQGVAPIILAAVDTGDETNLPPNTTLTWEFRDPNMAPTVTTTEQFTGGTDRETDGEHASRIQGEIRHKQGAGNDPQMRAWARKSSNAVADAYIYPCALNSGSTLVAIAQKRGGVRGPTARIPAPATMVAAISYLTPPASPSVPARVFVLVLPVVAQVSDFVLRLGLPKGAAAGWTDLYPFPSYHATTPTVLVSPAPTTTSFRLSAPGDATLPNQASGVTLTGANAPQLMVWNSARSEWIKLNVLSVQDMTGNEYQVTLSTQPLDGAGQAFVLASGQFVSPDIGRRTVIDTAAEQYFDELGPGDLFDVLMDARGARCLRFPRVIEEQSPRAGAVLATRIADALGGTAADVVLASMSVTTPSYPSIVTLGPNLIVAGKAGVYAL